MSREFNEIYPHYILIFSNYTNWMKFSSQGFFPRKFNSVLNLEGEKFYIYIYILDVVIARQNIHVLL